MDRELILIRHGQSEANVGLTDHPDSSLTPAGIDQARQLGLRLSKMELSGFVALCSPYARTRQTAELIAAPTGLRFETEELIREWGDAATVGGKQFHKETVEELSARLQRFLLQSTAARVLVVSHAAPIAVLTQLAWSEAPNVTGQFWAGVNNCCLRWLRHGSSSDGGR